MLAFELVCWVTDMEGKLSRSLVGECFPCVYSRFCSVESKASERGSSLIVRLQNSTSLSYIWRPSSSSSFEFLFPFRRHRVVIILLLSTYNLLVKNSTTVVPSYLLRCRAPAVSKIGSLLSTALKSSFQSKVKHPFLHDVGRSIVLQL